ncbi:hypothetical protein MJO28_014765 [Puccinia striiformis f. sp. tritici]|uniref:Uncharacterized protein n=1 Tax=Puccinia striiformis f. sp. tritici TaxID=168172 RepID=A0ACC0DVL8_9BASI|nr:hypothetical protein MJO28_014765 [Puccinia striiformis f. sp. tritici]
MLRHLRTPAIKKSDNLPRRIQLLKKIADKLSDKKEESLKAAIGALAQEKYKQPAKPLQIEAVYNLARGRNTFLLAGTGFGKLGYIPLSKDDPNYKREQEREKKAGLAACMCSNCTPAEGLLSRIKTMNIHNMEDMILRYWRAPEPLITTTKRKRATAGSGGTNTTRKKNKLSLPLNRIDKIIDKIETIDGLPALRKVAGGQTVPGQFEALYEAIEDFKSGPLANEELVRIEKETALHAVAMAEETEQAEVQAREKVTLDESKRIETEKSDTRLRIENDWKKEQQAHLKILIRRAGEEAERRGVQSIHRGRYSEDDGLLSGGSSSSPEIEDDVH